MSNWRRTKAELVQMLSDIAELHDPGGEFQFCLECGVSSPCSTWRVLFPRDA